MPPPDRRKPLRFVWQMDDDGRFTIGSDEFKALIGPQNSAALGRPWSEIAAALALDPDGQLARAFASRETWSGITAAFPVDGSQTRLTVELSGLPVFDRDRNFRGYRGFGICRDIARIGELAQTRGTSAPATPRVEPPVFREERPAPALSPVNVVPFPSSPPPDEVPSLTPVERSAFSELASRLSARLRNGKDETAAPPPKPIAEPPELPAAKAPERPSEPKERQPVRAAGADPRPILDRLPVGVLVYRLDKLIYANRAFLDWTGYEQLHALDEAGGLDALFVEPSTPRIRRQQRHPDTEHRHQSRRSDSRRSAAVHLAVGRRIRAGADAHRRRPHRRRRPAEDIRDGAASRQGRGERSPRHARCGLRRRRRARPRRQRPFDQSRRREAVRLSGPRADRAAVRKPVRAGKPARSRKFAERSKPSRQCLAPHEPRRDRPPPRRRADPAVDDDVTHQRRRRQGLRHLPRHDACGRRPRASC